MPLYLGTDTAGTQQYTLQDFEPSFGSKLNAAVRESWLESYGPVATDYFASRRDDGSPKLSADEAKSVVTESGIKGVKITPVDGQYTRGQLDVLLDRQRALQAAKDVRERTPWDAGSIVRGGAMFAAGIVDPINLATAFVPWTKSVGALRATAATASAGETLLARSAARAAIGAADAGISTAVLEPFNYYARQSIGDDYGAFDAMANIAFGTAFGGGLHVLGGAAGDVLRRFRTGDALTPEARARVEAARALPETERATAAEGLTPAEREALNLPTEAERAGMPEVTRGADTAVTEPVSAPRARAMAARIVDEGGRLSAQSDAGTVGGVVDGATLRLDTVDGGGADAALIERVTNEAIERGLTVTADAEIAPLSDAVIADLQERGMVVTRTDAAEVANARALADGTPTATVDATPTFVIERGPDYQVPVETAADVTAQVAPETREALLRASVAQSVDGRDVDVDAITGLDPSRDTATPRDAQAAADRNLQPEAQSLADFDASEAVQARIDAAPKWSSLADAEAQAAEVDAILADTVKAGDDAYKYAREVEPATPEAVELARRGEGNQNVPLYARGIPDDVAVSVIDAAVRRSFGASTDAMLEAGRIRVVATVEDLPGGPHPGDVQAATAPDGTVWVIARNTAPAEIRGLVLHEVGVHVGMEKMLGPQVFQSVLREIDDAVARGEDWAQLARAAVPEDTPPGLVREEQLAYLVQNSPELPLVQRILAAVRAWAYRTFEFARDRITLNEADLQALAVAALRAAAQDLDLPAGPMRYSRGVLPEPAKPADELKVFDDRIARAKQYPAVLRAAADKLESDALAVEAMKAALPDISNEEIADLLGQLRKSVQGLRTVTRSVRQALGAEEVVNDLQTDAMRAADTLANNIEMAAVIEKRNAALNMNARLKASTFLNQFRVNKLDFEGFRALLVGTERKRTGGRLSIDAEQKGYRGAWLGGLIADMTKAGQIENFASGAFDRDVFIALYRIGKGQDTAGLSPEAVQMATIVNKYQEDARNTRNRFGAWIRDLNGYITRQTHDQFKIRDAGEAEFKKTVLPLLDLERTMRDFQGTADDFLTRVYDDFATGSHMKAAAGEDDLTAFGPGSSLARRESASRVLYFKDGEAAYEYNAKFGQGKLADTVLKGLDNAASSVGLLKILGTNPEATATRLFDEYAESLRGDPKRRASFLQHRKELENLLSHVDGSANIPGSATAAKISSAARAWVSMSRLGGMLISSITDLSNYAAELRFGQNRNLLGGTLDGIGSLVQGRAKGEKKDILSALGVFHESTLGSVFARFDNPDLIGGKMSAAMQQFFKLSGINWWTESLRDGYALTHSNYLASNAKREYSALPDALRDMLSLYNIDASKWEILRVAPLREADGRMYMTPDGLRTVPRETYDAYITSVGRTPSDAAVANLQADLAQALRTMTIDRMHHAVIEPGARTRAFMLRGTQPGTVPGELLRFATQFKSFPVALIQMTLGREVYGRGYDTLGEYLRRGKGDMVGLASFLALSTAMGYAAMSVKDLLRGKNPRPVDDWRTWQAAMVQGGGLGIYGDFLFGKYNRMGGSLSGSLIGPAAGVADTVADLWTRIRNGDDAAAASFKAALDNTPFMNLFYTRTALDYLFLHSIQEALNPGFMRRSEQRIQRENGQTYYLPPSETSLRPFQ